MHKENCQWFYVWPLKYFAYFKLKKIFIKKNIAQVTTRDNLAPN